MDISLTRLLYGGPKRTEEESQRQVQPTHEEPASSKATLVIASTEDEFDYSKFGRDMRKGFSNRKGGE